MGTTLAFAEPTAAEEGTAVTVKYQICVDFPEESGDTSSLNVTLSQGNGADGLAAGSGLAAGDTSSKISGAQTAATETVSDGTSGDASGNVSLADAPINLTASINRLGTVGASGNVTIGAVTTKGSTMNVPLTVSASGPGNAVLILRLLDAEDKPAVFPEKTACAEASTAKTIRGNLAIFDLGTAQMSGSEYNVSIPDLSAGSYKVQADICVVPSEEYASPMHGWVGSSHISGAAEISGPEIYGITAELAGNGDDRIVSNDTGNRLTFNVTYTAPEDSQAHVDISVESKTTGGFYGLDRPDWTVGGPDISETEGGSSMVQYTVSIPAGTPKGTYRINFTLNYTDSSGKTASVTHPYNIIVQ